MRRPPLFVVTGASGSGKTAVTAPLGRLLDDCAVVDVDWLLDAFGRACAPGPVDWPVFNDAWLGVAFGLAQGGRHTVLLGSVMADQLAGLPMRPWFSEVHFAVLDCADDVRRARLAARPRWRGSIIERHLAFAAHLRANTGTAVATDRGGPGDAARELARWVRGHLDR